MDLLSKLTQLVQSGLTLFTLLGMVAGAIQCFFGYRIFRIILGVIGFIAGAAFGAMLSGIYMRGEAGLILGGILGGVIGAVVLIAVYIVGVFLLGGLLGWLAALGLFALDQRTPVDLVVILFGIAGGVAAILLQKFIIIFSTSFTGAFAVIWGLISLGFGNLGAGDFNSVVESVLANVLLLGVGTLVLGIAGMVVQYRTVPPKAQGAPVGQTAQPTTGHALQRAPEGHSSAPRPPALAYELSRLQDLLESGAISQQDYEAKKADILEKR